MFGDKKRFNCDVMDGLRSYRHDLRKEKSTFSKRQRDGNEIMVSETFRVFDRTKLVQTRSCLNGQGHTKILEK